MKMTPGVRKVVLTAHVSCSVGWLGAVTSFLVLSIAGLTSQNAEIVRGVYLAMNLIGQNLIVPLSFATLLTGLAQSLGTEWGLFRYYWVMTKLVLTLGATLLLLLHQFTAVTAAAQRVLASPAGTLPTIGRLGPQLVFDAGLAAVVLLGGTAISIFKPWGRTAYGSRPNQIESGPPLEKSPATGKSLPLGLKILFGAVGVFVVAVVVLHLTGHGFGGHGH